MPDYDALLLVSFGGPEHPDHVIPFLENVTRGRGVPPERLAEVAEHYRQFGGVSPINEQNRQLLAAIADDFAATGTDLKIYWGNRNWEPFLDDTLAQMADDGIERAIAFVTSAYSSYSGCRQYRENIEAAVAAAGPNAPTVDKLRVFYDHPGFIDPFVDSTVAALERLGSVGDNGAPAPPIPPRLVFTAHSIPESMADRCDYADQLAEASRLVSERVTTATGLELERDLVYQSRSGPPQVPWLEPDVVAHLHTLHDHGTTAVVVVPIGFVSDHLEVKFDLDTEAAQAARELGMAFERAATPGADPRFVSMVRQLIEERSTASPADDDRQQLGTLAVKPDLCRPDCCLPAPRPTRTVR